MPIVATARMRARGLIPRLGDELLRGDDDGRGAVDDAARVAGSVEVLDGLGLRVRGEGDLRRWLRRRA